MNVTHLHMPKLFIFDMDGLLFDTERLFMEKRAAILPEYGYVHREEDYIRTLGTGGDALGRILTDIYGAGYPAAEISARSRAAQLEHIRTYGVPVRPGIPALLSRIQSRRIPCCVATSSDTASAEEILDRGGLRGFFSFVIGGDCITHSKPDPEIFLSACKKGRVLPDEALVLEDSENGILAAAAAGIPVICIPDMKQPDPAIACRAARVVQSAEDVISLFD